MSLRIKRLPIEVKQANTLAEKQAAMQRFVDQCVEGLGHQLTVPTARLDNQEHRRFTVHYQQAHRMWQLQVENPAQDMEIGQQVMESISHRVAGQINAAQAAGTDKKKPAQRPLSSGASSAPAPGGRPGADTLAKPGGPPDDSRGIGPKGNVTGG